MGLARPEVQLTLKCNGMSIVNKPATTSLRASVASLFPGQSLDGLREVAGKAGSVRVAGLLPQPDTDTAFSTSETRQFFFVNKRPVLHKALSRQLKAMLSHQARKAPMAILFFDIPPALVDVNVTPSKDRVMLPAETERDLLAAIVLAATPLCTAALPTPPQSAATGANTAAVDAGAPLSAAAHATTAAAHATTAAKTNGGPVAVTPELPRDATLSQSHRQNTAVVDYRLPTSRLTLSADQSSAASSQSSASVAGTSTPGSSQSSLLRWSMGHGG